MTMDILKAIETESLGTIKELIKTEESTFFSSYYGYKSLNRALESGRKDIVKFLLSDSRCVVNRSCNSSDMTIINTPMHNAIKLGDIEIVDTLLKRGALITIVNSDGDSPLHLAFQRRYESIVDRILTHVEKTLNYKNVKNSDGLTHLHVACTRKNKKVIVGFVKAKANVDDVFCKNSPSSWAGYTAMHFAVEFKSAEAIAILSRVVSGGTVFNVKACNGQTPLKLAREYLENFMIAMDRLDGQNEGLSYFHLACLKDDASVVKKFIENGADVHRRIHWHSDVCSDYFPLHCALESPVDRSEKVNLLLKHGARVQRYYDEEETVPLLHLALYTEAIDEVDNPTDLLYDALVDKKDNIVDGNGLSIFHIAVTRNDFKIVKYYLDNGVDVNRVLKDNSRMYSNYSALHFAVNFQRLEMAKFLMDRGADVNVNFGKSNYTPLFAAMAEGNIDFDAVEFLFRHGARIDVVYCNKTLLHFVVASFAKANEDDQAKILMYVETLVYMGVDVNAVDNENSTALHNLWWSFEKSCAPCAKLLLDLGADINVEACEVGLPFEAFRGNDCSSEECMIFLRHVKRLKALGLYICPRNEKSCEIISDTMDKRKLTDMDEELNDEIMMLKNIKVTAHLTLYQFLMLDSKRAAAYVHNGVLKRIIEDIDVGERFAAYGCLIKLQYRRALSDKV